MARPARDGGGGRPGHGPTGRRRPSQVGGAGMKARLLRTAEDLRTSYWFLPSLMAFTAVLLASAMIWIDTHVGSGWMDG
ncbi:MAG: hypothetical protein KAX56_14080, partial [Phenylobacterium sp.]|nr:hypothetical protein [Phenylobacterium sp.]